MNGHFRVLPLSCFSALVFIAASALVLPAMAGPQPPPIPIATARQPAGPPPGVDLDVTYIQRTPLYKAYCVQYRGDAPNQPGRPFLCPGTENDRRWPQPGEVVTFTAHIVNKGASASPGAGYAWYIDGAQVGSGTLSALAPGAGATAAYQWPWGHGLSPDGQRALGEHSVRFTVDPGGAIAETYESNNSLEDRTEATSLSIYLPPEIYDAYNTPVDDLYPYSAEDWLQKQIAAMNAALANATYPATPQGAPLRVRLDVIGVSSSDPGPDGEHDGGWYLRDDIRHEGGYYEPATDIDWGLVHELSHQVSLIDLYAIGVYAPNVLVQDRNGMPCNFGFGWLNGGLMFGGDTAPHNNPHLYESHSAGGAATFAGYRNGYYGSYLFDIPLDNTMRVLDSQGNPAPGVEVALYQRTGPWDAIGHMGVDSIPEISGATGADGLFHLPNRSANGGSVTANGHVLHDNPFGVVDIVGNQGLFLVRLARGEHEEFHWLDITQFNLAYWLGDTISHTFTISSHAPPPGAPVAPEQLMPRVEGARASLAWSPSPSAGVVGYRVYRATPPLYEYLAASGLITDTRFVEECGGECHDGQHRVYAVVAVDGSGRESGFGEFVYAPGIGDPVAVALAPDGARVVLNNGNLYPLLRQRPDGRYTQRLVNPHYDLGHAHSLAYGPPGRLLVGGLGESPAGRRAVRVYDGELRPVLAFGEEGSGAGQFIAPSGLAWWGKPFSYGGPYQVDSRTLFLLHLDGSLTGAQGQEGTASGVSFAPGKHGQGALVDGEDTLTYPIDDNINPAQGAIEFWVQPQWNGDDGQMHVFFETADPGDRGIQISKDGVGNLHFILWTPQGADGVVCSLLDWRAGEWHHLAVAWDAKETSVYLDGRQCGQRDGVRAPEALEGVFFVGGSPGLPWQADAVLDELRISDAARVGNSDAGERILVADSGAQRIQAFDALGNFRAAFGSLGSGDGQLDTPQGVAVDSGGRVIVADQGNNRLQVLSFDGQAFAPLASFSAGLNAPTGVAVDARDNIYIADTGNNRVVALDRQGAFLAQYTAPNDGYMGPFSRPRGVAVEPDGDIVVADTGNRRVVTIRNPSTQNRWCLPIVGKAHSLGADRSAEEVKSSE